MTSKSSQNSQGSRTRLQRATFAAGAALTVVVAVAGAAPGAGAAQESTARKPKLKLIAATNSVTLDRYEWDGASGVFLDLGTYVSVDDAPFEFKVTRKSYKDPVVAQQVLRDGTST